MDSPFYNHAFWLVSTYARFIGGDTYVVTVDGKTFSSNCTNTLRKMVEHHLEHTTKERSNCS